MNFKLFLLWTFVLLGRPQDLILALQLLRPALVLAILNAGTCLINTNAEQFCLVLRLPETKRYLLFYVLMIIGIPFAYHRRVAFDFVFLTYLMNVLFYFSFVLNVNSLKKMKAVLFVIALCTFLYGFFGIMKGTFSQGRFQIYGGMFDPNDIAYILISLFPLSFYFMFHCRGYLKKIVASIGIITSVMLILYSGSRGGLIALVVLAVLLLVAERKYVKLSYKIVFVIFMILTLFIVKDRVNLERYSTLANIHTDYNITDEFGRIQLWKRAIDLTLINPLTGVGVDCSSMAIGYTREALGLIPMWEVVHNSYLQIAAEMGIFAFLIFIMLIFSSYRTFQLVRKSRLCHIEGMSEICIIGWLFRLSFIGHLITAFFLSQGYSILFTLYFAFSVVIKRLHVDLKKIETSLK